MATTKSTVVGIRLDHERRAWVEAEAARLGVSVRGLFEGMIDEARSVETVDAGGPLPEPGTAPGLTAVPPMEEVTDASWPERPATSGRSGSVNAGPSSSQRQNSGAPSVPGLGLVTGIPGGLIRGAFSLTANLIESSGRCATNKLGHCALTRRWVDRSL
jgi:hypothetical protein